MTKEDIIRLAREAGLKKEDYWVWHIDPLERFANLIEEHLKSQGYRQCAKGQRATQFCGMVEQAVQAERKRIIDMLRDMHAHEVRHNYYGFIANMIKESA